MTIQTPASFCSRSTTVQRARSAPSPIQPSRSRRSTEQAFRRQPVPVLDLPAWAQGAGGRPARAAIENLLGILGDLHDAAQSDRPAASLQQILDRTGYASWLAVDAKRSGHVE